MERIEWFSEEMKEQFYQRLQINWENAKTKEVTFFTSTKLINRY